MLITFVVHYATKINYHIIFVVARQGDLSCIQISEFQKQYIVTSLDGLSS